MKLRLAALLTLCLPALLHAETFRFYGHAYELDSGRYLYTEVHEQEIVDERWLRGRIRYFDPQGQLIGDKTLDFSADPFIPVYRLELPYKDYAEGISQVGKRLTLYKSSKGERREKTLDRRDGMAADSGFHTLIREYFPALMRGETVRFTLAVAGNLDSFRFRVLRTGQTTFDGKDAVRLRVEPDSLLRLIADPLDLIYEPKQRQLLEYRGISNIHDPATGNAYNARIIYPDQPPADAPKSLPPLTP
jgi:hypothetical protein